ncbi:MAG: NAD(P)-binding protein [Sarcina sp.]
MKKVNIVGCNILGLVSAIKLLRKGYLVDIYEKRNYIGGMLNSFDGVNLSKPQLFYDLISDDIDNLKIDTEFSYLNFKKTNNYKKIKFTDGTIIDIDFGYESIKNILLTYTESKNDKVLIQNILKDVLDIYQLEKQKKIKVKYPIFNLNKWFEDRQLNKIISKYKKHKVEVLVDKIESIHIKEIIKSLVNVKCSAMVFIEMLKVISFFDIYKIENVLEGLKKELVSLGGNIFLASNISEITSTDEKAFIKIGENYLESDYVICTVNNFYSLRNIFDEEILEKEFQRTLHDGELFDSYVIINLYFKEIVINESNITRYILEKPFIDNTGSFHRKFEISFDAKRNIGSIYIRGNYHFWEQLNQKNIGQVAYSKFLLGQKFLEELNKCNSEFTKENVKSIDVITPYDFMLENDCIRGASRGIIPTPKFYTKELKYKNDIGKCYFATDKLYCGSYLNSKIKDSIRIVEKILLE